MIIRALNKESDKASLPLSTKMVLAGAIIHIDKLENALRDISKAETIEHVGCIVEEALRYSNKD